MLQLAQAEGRQPLAEPGPLDRGLRGRFVVVGRRAGLIGRSVARRGRVRSGELSHALSTSALMLGVGGLDPN
jgi:hypothetical protein